MFGIAWLSDTSSNLPLVRSSDSVQSPEAQQLALLFQEQVAGLQDQLNQLAAQGSQELSKLKKERFQDLLALQDLQKKFDVLQQKCAQLEESGQKMEAEHRKLLEERESLQKQMTEFQEREAQVAQILTEKRLAKITKQLEEVDAKLKEIKKKIKGFKGTAMAGTTVTAAGGVALGILAGPIGWVGLSGAALWTFGYWAIRWKERIRLLKDEQDLLAEKGRLRAILNHAASRT